MLITEITVTTITAWVKAEICCICVATFSVPVWSELWNWWMCFPSSRHCVINTPAPPHQQQPKKPAPLSPVDCSTSFLGNNCLATQQCSVLWVMCSPADFDFSHIFRPACILPCSDSLLQLGVLTNISDPAFTTQLKAARQFTWWFCFSGLLEELEKVHLLPSVETFQHLISTNTMLTGSLLKRVCTEHSGWQTGFHLNDQRKTIKCAATEAVQ